MLRIVSYEKNNSLIISAEQVGGEIPFGSPWELFRTGKGGLQDDGEGNY